MQRHVFALTALIAATQVGLACCFLFGPVDRISDRLANKVPSKDVDESLRAAGVWLSDLRAGKGGVQDLGLANGLETFVKLATIREDKHCDIAAYNLIDEVDRLTGERIFNTKVKKARVLELITREVARDHAVSCHLEHMAQLEARYAQMDGESVKRVKYLEYFDRFYYETRLPTDVCLHKRLDDSQLAILLREYLKEMPTLVENNPQFSQFKGTGQEKVGQLVDEYIMAPCREYVQATSDLNELALRDAKHMRPETDNFFAYTRSPFERAAPMYCLCKLYLDRGASDVTRLAETLVSEIKFYQADQTDH